MLTQERLREVLTYDPNTGIFRWAVSRGQRAQAGNEAGSAYTEYGHRRIHIEGKTYQAGRLAWLYVTGSWPFPEIDFKNGNPADLRFANLREATPQQNAANRRTSNLTGTKGVSISSPGRFRAQICINGKRIELGAFDTIEEANAAYAKAATEAFGEYARAS
jgi:hypothetical protein